MPAGGLAHIVVSVRRIFWRSTSLVVPSTGARAFPSFARLCVASFFPVRGRRVRVTFVFLGFSCIAGRASTSFWHDVVLSFCASHCLAGVREFPPAALLVRLRAPLCFSAYIAAVFVVGCPRSEYCIRGADSPESPVQTWFFSTSVFAFFLQGRT